LVKVCSLLIFTVLLSSFLSFSAPASASSLDYIITNGHFFTQTNGSPPGASRAGYSIIDDAAAPLWSEYQRLGGVATLGYPASRRFAWHGFVSQVTQKAVLQWRPEVGEVYFANIFDLLHESGKDDWLMSTRQVPPPWDTADDAGLDWPAVVRRHLSFLDANPAIRAAYWGDSDPLSHFGLPMSSADFGSVFVVRAQRAVFQYWRTDVPWAPAGSVTVGNGGDVAKEAGLFPAEVTTPQEAEAVPRIRWAYYVPTDPKSLDSLKQYIDALDCVSPTYFSIDAAGVIKDEETPVVTSFIKSRNVKVLPMVKNSARGADFHGVLANPAVRAKAIDAILNLVLSRGYDGIHIDFEGLSASDRPYLTTFMADLAAALHPRGKLVTMAVAAKTQESTTGWAGPYDYAALARHNDLILLMAYGYYSSSGTTAGPTSPFSWVEGSIAYASTQIGAAKLLLGLPWYGYDWNRTKGPPATALRYGDAIELARRNGAIVRYDDRVQAPFFTYSAAGEEHEVWFENAQSFEAKLALALKYDLAGVGGWRLGHEDPSVWAIFSRLGAGG